MLLPFTPHNKPEPTGLIKTKQSKTKRKTKQNKNQIRSFVQTGETFSLKGGFGLCYQDLLSPSSLEKLEGWILRNGKDYKGPSSCPERIYLNHISET